MLKPSTTVAACLTLAMIGGILAYSISPAASSDAGHATAVPAAATAQGNPQMPVEAGGNNATAGPDERQIAQLFRPPTIRRAARAASLAGSVQVAGSPVAGATVTLYAAGSGAPTQLAQGQTTGDGAFNLNVGAVRAGSVLYLVAKGGTPKATGAKGPNDAIALMSLLGTSPPNKVTVNELTTVASAYTAARFINGESISGNLLGLRIAAGNAPNLVDPVTGGWGKVLLDPLNSTQTTTLANLNTLGSLISASATVANDDWRARFFKAATPPSGSTPTNTLGAAAGIARAPWANPKELFALFDEAYPQPKDGSRRAAPFLPYLAYSPAGSPWAVARPGLPQIRTCPH